MDGRLTLIFITGIILFSLYSCEKWDLSQATFVQVEIMAIDTLSIDSVRITGRIKDLDEAVVQEHGFLWTTQEIPPTYFFKEGSQSLGIKTKEEEQSFSAVVKLDPNTTYNFRGYANVNEEYIYSENREYHSGQGQVYTQEISYQNGYSLEITGRLSGTEKGLVAIKHGFCWSLTNPHPTLEDNFVNLGERRNNEVFMATIDSLQNDRTHYFRAYAILSFNFKPDTVFGMPLSFDGNLNYWARRMDFGGGPRDIAFCFSIGQKGYIGTGGNSVLLKRDLWEYDPAMNLWTQKADFGGGPWMKAVGFSIGQKGYAGTGWSSWAAELKSDFWEYDPTTNTWARKADFGGGPREFAVGFSIGQKGYIGTGRYNGEYLNDFWEYSPEADTWVQKADFGGEPRFSAIGISIGSKGYIGIGRAGSEERNDFWEYSPEADTWVQKANFEGGPRSSAVGFSIGQRGYIGTGWGSGQRHNDFWEYSPEADIWQQRTDFGGEPRSNPVGFSIGQKGYIGTGLSLLNLDDFWEYDP